MNKVKKIVFVWENFGPLHIDRISSTTDLFRNEIDVLGIEMFSKSETYDWVVGDIGSVKKRTLFKNKSISNTNFLSRFLALFNSLWSVKKSAIIFCHYERLEVFFCAMIMRFIGRKVYVMNVSKFDDGPRLIWKEVVKWVFHLPYMGGISSGGRSSEYMKFLGVPGNNIHIPYNSLSLNRISEFSLNQSKSSPYQSRYFIVVSRFVEKKNLFCVIDAFANYRNNLGGLRRLRMIGSGYLEADLKKHAEIKGVDRHIDWMGFLQDRQVTENLSGALALILISTEEQFGNVVLEAMAVGVPCIVSPQVGARDLLVKSFISGFIVEDDNPIGVSHFMNLIGHDDYLWNQLSCNAMEVVRKFDSSNFALAISDLINFKK